MTMKLNTTSQQIEICTSTRRKLETIAGHPIGVLIWCLGSVAFYTALQKGVTGGRSMDWALMFGIGVWLVFGGYSLYAWAEILFGHEKIVITKDAMTIGHYIGRWGRTTTYDVSQIKTISIAPKQKRRHGQFLLEYGTQQICCGKNMTPSDVTPLVNTLTQLFSFQCHATESIIFGDSQISYHGVSRPLYNPDVSTLAIPFIQLKRLGIQTETYDFHLVEYFLTYAINTIDRIYLKHHVDVHIYGNIEKLHPNLRNNFITLCKSVYLHTASHNDVIQVKA
jgi:hypothetical protein